MSNVMVHYGVKGMRWGVRRKTPSERREIRKKQKKELRKNAEDHASAALLVKRAKRTAGAGAFALGTAALGSVATKRLADKGEIALAASVYKLSRTTFNNAVFYAKVNAGMLAFQAMMTSPESVKDYVRKNREIKNKYK